jgi:hypothetical protein
LNQSQDAKRLLAVLLDPPRQILKDGPDQIPSFARTSSIVRPSFRALAS